MLRTTPLDAASAHGKALDLGRKIPKNKGCLVHNAAGVVSETRDYNEGTHSRPYFSLAGGV